MDSYNWRCACGHVVDGLGLMSLSHAIREHEREKHGELTNRTIDEIAASPQFWKSSPQRKYTEPSALCSGRERPTYAEMRWLESMTVLWDGDNRTPEELAGRYRNNTDGKL